VDPDSDPEHRVGHIYLMEKSAKVLLDFGLHGGMLEFLLTSCNPKNIWYLSRIFEAGYGGKIRRCKPWSNKQVVWFI
jgi:hypothetical protein